MPKRVCSKFATVSGMAAPPPDRADRLLKSHCAAAGLAKKSINMAGGADQVETRWLSINRAAAAAGPGDEVGQGLHLWNGVGDGDREPERQQRLISLFRVRFDDPLQMRSDLQGKPVYLGLAMTAEGLLRLKPQNLLINLPLSAAVHQARVGAQKVLSAARPAITSRPAPSASSVLRNAWGGTCRSNSCSWAQTGRTCRMRAVMGCLRVVSEVESLTKTIDPGQSMLAMRGIGAGLRTPCLPTRQAAVPRARRSLVFAALKEYQAITYRYPEAGPALSPHAVPQRHRASGTS